MNLLWRIFLRYSRWQAFSGDLFEVLKLKQKLINLTNQINFQDEINFLPVKSKLIWKEKS